MLIELDLDEAKRLKLTINQFLLIKLVLDNVKADSYQNVIHLSSGDIKELIDKNKSYTDICFVWKFRICIKHKNRQINKYLAIY